jgi:class 3 adenylate cyclase
MASTIAKASVELESSAKKLWPLIGNTEQINRAMGQEPYTLSPVDEKNKSGARYVVASSEGLFSMDHEALPFEWENEKSLKVVRKMIGGALETITLLVTLEPGKKPGGTRVDISLEVVARSVLAKPFASIAAHRYVQRYVDLTRKMDAYAQGDDAAEAVFPMATPSQPDVASAARDRLIAAGVRRDLAVRLTKHVSTAPDIDVIHMRPFEIADDWKIDRTELLKAFLQSVLAGLTELRWSIICPSCRTASEHVSSLQEISAQGHCQLCDISFDLDLDRSIEATFLPHDAVRSVIAQPFCIGGPSRTPHVISQANLDPSASHDLTAPAESGRFRIFARGGANASIEVEEGAASSVNLTVEASTVRPNEAHVKPGGKIKVTNQTDEGRHVKLERLGYASAAATAHVVSTLEEFRRFFSTELLKRETPLKVSHVAIMFSDLVGSTALYSSIGDAAAFRLVDDHFDLLREIIGRHEGVVVKTMGDAILAAFTDASKATAAAAESLEKFESFRSARPHGDKIGIKLGLFAGACYVVQANGALDYFGQVVNVASRVQHLAGSGEILLPKEIFSALGSDLKGTLELLEELEACVKGVEQPIPLVRVRRKAAT